MNFLYIFNIMLIAMIFLIPIMTMRIWSEEKKQDYVNDAKLRLEKSKWMLAVIIPFMLTVLLDAVYLFTWPMVQNLFNIK